MIHGNPCSQRKLLHCLFFSQLSPISPHFTGHKLSRSKLGKSISNRIPTGLGCQDPNLSQRSQILPRRLRTTWNLVFQKKKTTLDSYSNLVWMEGMSWAENSEVIPKSWFGTADPKVGIPIVSLCKLQFLWFCGKIPPPGMRGCGGGWD